MITKQGISKLTITAVALTALMTAIAPARAQVRTATLPRHIFVVMAPDLVLQSYDNGFRNGSPTIYVSVKNQGNGPAGPCILSIRTLRGVFNVPMPALRAGEPWTKEVETGISTGRVDFHVDSTFLVRESDERNNWQSVIMP